MLAYLTAAACCFLAVRRAAPADRRLWLILGSALTILACNKQLDLQSHFTNAMRDLAHTGGWYAHRRLAQFMFLLALAISGALIAVWLVIRMRRSEPGLKFAVAGLLCLILFVVGRAASFHHLDEALGWQMGRIRLNVVPELAGSLLVAFGALRAALSSGPSEAEHEIRDGAVVPRPRPIDAKGAAGAEL